MSSPTEPFEFANEDEPQDQEADAVEPEEEEEPSEPEDLSRRIDELDRQYRESSKEGRRLHAELVRAQERERALMQALESTRQPAPEPREPRWRERLVAAGVPEEAIPAIEEMVENSSGVVAERKVAQLMEPFLKAAEAQGQIHEELGDFDRDQVFRFLRENPDVKVRYDRRVVNDPVGAMALALLKMREDQAYDSEAGMHADHEEAEEVKRQARKAARVTGSKRAVPKDRGEDLEATGQRLKKLAEHGLATRNYAPFATEYLKTVPSMRNIKWADSDEE